ncbi:flagellar export chaperone FlgN [Clostridium uliginosum]|uniref:FlgN protein n=1 Tax=Clostridium uliginosum TaxID=119641 RepID=A0A1I1KIR5_9CLOT|nr:flagellar export chaperone FlgN [Clostridium uliginosum]SFC60455.1 FlgN protein [Clostridium uliginosum]
MISNITQIVKIENDALKELLLLLDTQYKMIMDKDAFGLEGLVDKLNECNKKIAAEEINRRKLIGKESMIKIVTDSENEDLKKNYDEIKDTLDKITIRKETNEVLLKQEIIFNTKMLALMNPSRDIKTYNSYGNLRK